MYDAIVRRRVVDLFAAVSNGNARPVLEGLAPRFEHFFLGDHALGGSRFTLQKTRLWYERLYRLLPDISFDLRAIRISGPPWNTLVAVDWLESNSGTDGVRTFTPGVHVVVGQDDGKVPTFSRNRDGLPESFPSATSLNTDSPKSLSSQMRCARNC